MKSFIDIRKSILLGFFSILYISANGQFIDNYGLKIGVGLSNQYFDYKNDLFSNLSGWKDDKAGFSGQFYAEKSVGKYLSIRPTIGYIQKGYLEEITFITREAEYLAVKDKKVFFHDLNLDLAIKIIPIQKKLSPYLFVGLRGDYLLDYKSVVIDFQGEDVELKDMYDEFNKMTLGGLIGVGLSYNDILFLDFEYNPAITKNFESDGLLVNDKYFSLTFGLNINSIIKDKNK